MAYCHIWFLTLWIIYEQNFKLLFSDKIHNNIKFIQPYNTVEHRYLELAYFELPHISKWKSDPYFKMTLWQQVIK